MPDVEARFSPTWEVARDRFRAATGPFPRGALEVQPGYTLDWALTGDPQARDLLVFSSGLHGVEGYAGSAAQLELLAALDDTPTLWLHTLNPWGMAHLRRFNESNVDLNRNFLAPGQPYTAFDPTYAIFDPVLNPPTPPGFDLFWPRAAGFILRHGFQALKNTVVGGQHQNPKGLFFGGSGPEATNRVLLPFLDTMLGDRRRVVHVDLHTGLGPHGGRSLLLEGKARPGQLERCRAAFGPALQSWGADNSDAYEIRGGMLAELQRRLDGVRFDGLTCEFGTWQNLRVLAALREENRLHHWGEPTPDHPAKRRLLEAFVPASPAWRTRVLEHAHALRAAGRAALGSE